MYVRDRDPVVRTTGARYPDLPDRAAWTDNRERPFIRTVPDQILTEPGDCLSPLTLNDTTEDLPAK